MMFIKSSTTGLIALFAIFAVVLVCAQANENDSELKLGKIRVF